MRLKLAALGAVLGILLVGCGTIDSINDSNGKGDAPVGVRDDSAADVLNFPDGYGNVAMKCDGHGNRVYQVTSTQYANTQVVILPDASCRK